MKVIDLRRHVPEADTIIDMEPGDIVRFPDGNNLKAVSNSRWEVISAEEAQMAQVGSDRLIQRDYLRRR